MNKGTYWKKMAFHNQGEPICETPYFDDVIQLLADELETGRDHSVRVLELLRIGASEYIERCMKFEGIDQDISE